VNQNFMQEAVEISRRDMRLNKGGPFGAVIVRGNHIVGRGSNQVTSRNDPTAHAEILAIREASQRLESFRLNGCDLYTSCEPCPMCLAAVYWARIDRVFFANTREDAARAGFDDSIIYHEIALPMEQRRIVMQHVQWPDACVVLEEWRVKPDKATY
jgi:guanine deaminase